MEEQTCALLALLHFSELSFELSVLGAEDRVIGHPVSIAKQVIAELVCHQQPVQQQQCL